MWYPPAFLEDWMRVYYPGAEIDMGSSGVQPFAFQEVLDLTGLDMRQLGSVLFDDSPCTGGRNLRAAISQRMGNGNPDWVIATHGASEAIYVMLMTILDAGDHAVALKPGYHSHTSIAESLGAGVSYWVLREENGFDPDLDDLRAVVRRETKVIVVNFPHNPTGVTLTATQLDDLVTIASSVDAYLLWDSAFSELVYNRSPLPDPLLSYPKTISVGTFSKAFGLPGMRFGWCQARPELISRVINLRDRVTLSLSPLIEFIAYHVIQHADEIIGIRLRQAAANRARLARWASQNSDHIELSIPQGGVTTFPRLTGHAETRGFCKRLGEDHRVLVVPGSAFDHPSRVRLGFGGPRAGFEQGLDLIAKELGRDA